MTDASYAVYGKHPEELSRAEFAMMAYAIEAAGWRQHRDSRYRRVQDAHRKPIDAPEDIDDGSADDDRPWAA